MNVALSERAIASLASAPAPVQRAFLKQIAYLRRDLFSIESGVYFIRDVIPHPK